MGEKKKSSCIIKKHNCKSEYQDITYGKGNRVFNHKLDRTKLPTCTVCGKSA